MNESESVAYQCRVDTITKIAIDTLGSVETANVWMQQPNSALGKIAPIDLLSSDMGAVQVMQVLNAVKTGGVI